MLTPPYPELDDLLHAMGETGRAGEIGEGLSADEIRAICARFNIQQAIF